MWFSRTVQINDSVQILEYIFRCRNMTEVEIRVVRRKGQVIVFIVLYINENFIKLKKNA